MYIGILKRNTIKTGSVLLFLQRNSSTAKKQQHRKIPARGLGINIASPRLVKMFHKAGVLVHVWTINDPEKMSQLIYAGVDGIVTDRADLAVSQHNN